MKRVRLTDESLNYYGTWIKTDGLDISQYERNPILLYMHNRGEVIGIVKDIKVEGGEVTGELVFDEVTERSQSAKKQWEFGSLRMVSVGIDIIEMSDDPSVIKPGQRNMTIIKSKLTEVSLVDIGANDNAIVLSHNGARLECGTVGKWIPLLNTNKTQEMELKTLALKLGLAEMADESAVLAKIDSLLEMEESSKTIKAQMEAMTLATVTAAVDAAIVERRITADKKDHFISLGKQVGIDTLNTTLAAMAPAAKASAFVAKESGKTEWNRLSDVPQSELEAMRSERLEEYRRLYEAEYKVKCEI
ncbi:MAG: HK97 family phage prohead protease [Bacteroidales bacterium]|nr:HK97 family phage prohead protease [Bacteroidales bacterium]